MDLAALFKEKVGQFDVDPKITHHFSDNLYAKEMFIPAGFVAGQHAHEYSHLSLLAKGKVKIIVDGETKEFRAPACINIEAKKRHLIEAIEDCVWYCIHATNESDPDQIDEVLIQRG